MPTAALNRKAMMIHAAGVGDGPVIEVPDDLGTSPGPRDADHAADGAERDGFDQELQEDVAAARADGHADADLARPLGHADEHDVHDADAADDERDAGDAGRATHVMVLDCGGCGVGDFLLVAHGEIVILARR